MNRFKLIAVFLFILNIHLQAVNNQIILMLDCSDSMQDELEELQNGARKFVELTPLNCSEIAIYTFGAKSNLPFTSNKDKLLKFINGLSSNGYTPMYTCLNNIYADIYGKNIKGICLFTDGNPTDELVSKHVKIRNDVPIYSIGYGLDDNGERVLHDLASKSGGESRFSSEVAELETLFSDFSVRISSKDLTADIVPAAQEKNVPVNQGEKIKGYYYFDKSLVFSNNAASNYTEKEKSAIISYLKTYGYPNAIYFDKTEVKLLTIEEKSNQSEWLNGTILFDDDYINIHYNYVGSEYDIKVQVVNSHDGLLILKLIEFIEDKDWALIKNGQWNFDDQVTALMIYFVKDYCKR